MPESQKCEFCNGTGKATTCFLCGGSGNAISGKIEWPRVHEASFSGVAKILPGSNGGQVLLDDEPLLQRLSRSLKIDEFDHDLGRVTITFKFESRRTDTE